MKTALRHTGIHVTRELEAKYKRLVERAYNLKQTDDSLSDILYFEAEKLVQQLQKILGEAEPA